jgi:hypothetical protein
MRSAGLNQQQLAKRLGWQTDEVAGVRRARRGSTGSRRRCGLSAASSLPAKQRVPRLQKSMY